MMQSKEKEKRGKIRKTRQKIGKSFRVWMF